MSISSIGGSMTDSYAALASGTRITSASVDPAGLAIANKLETQSNSYDVGVDNAAISQSMVNVADGALGSIGDYLQIIRELSVQASNTAIYSDSEINSLQQEIDLMKHGITDVVKTTQFNTKNLLDGTMTNSNVATNPDGSGLTLNLPDVSLNALGIADYDVTGNFKLSDIDTALEKISSARSSLGASSNRLDSVMSYNSNASYNLTAARSGIEDLDMAEAISELKKNQVMQQYQLMMQKKEKEHEADGVVRLLQ